MTASKLYLGRQVRDLRQAGELTQVRMAERLGISPIYLDQIENNQRPVSAAVLLGLAEKFKIDLADILQADNARILATLRETLFDSHAASARELKPLTQNARDIGSRTDRSPSSVSTCQRTTHQPERRA